MQLKVVSFKRSQLFVLAIAVMLLSCSSKVMLYRGELFLGGKNSDSGMSILEIAQPTVEAVEHANLHHRSYKPSEQQNVWIASIDDEPITNLLGKDQDPRTIKRYHILPGIHKIALMFEGDGLSDRFIHMFEDSVRMTFEYNCTVKRPVIFEIETAPDDVYVIETHASQGTCNFSLTKEEVLVAENAGTLRYKYSNVWDPKNWHLIQGDLLHEAASH